MEQTITYQLSANDFIEAINVATKQNTKENLIGSFSDLIDSKTVIGILGVHPNTLTKLVKTKALKPTNGDSSKYLFRLSEVLIFKLENK
jgi:hypothetical protein